MLAAQESLKGLVKTQILGSHPPRVSHSASLGGAFRMSTSKMLLGYADVLVARAAIPKFHRLGGLTNRSLFSHNSGG